MIFVVYDIRTGQIVSNLSSVNVETAQMNCAVGQSILPVPEIIDDSAFYVDVANQNLKPIPNKTTDFDTWDWSTKAWIAPDIAVLKAARINVLKKARDRSVFDSFVWDGSRFDSDSISQARLLGLYVSSLKPDYEPTLWRLYDNTWRMLSASEAAQVYTALSEHIRSNFTLFASLESEINSASTPAEIDAVVWPELV